MKGLIFDLDGVLVDVSSSYHAAILETVQVLSKKKISKETIYDYKLKPGLNNDAEVCMAILREMGITVEMALVIEQFQNLLTGDNWNGFIRNDIWLLGQPALKRLSAMYQLGIVTGRNRAETGYTLRKFDTNDYFKAVVTLDDIASGRDKPSPDGIFQAISELRTDSNIFFGDTVNDVIAASQAGIRSISVIRANACSPKCRDCLLEVGTDAVINDINDIMEVLNE